MNRIVLLLLTLNTVMVLVGLLGIAWQVRREAARHSLPSNFARLVDR